MRRLGTSPAIDAKTSRCRWIGEPMDYSMAIEGMQWLRDRAADQTKQSLEEASASI